ncbi:hypothetical protein EMPG_13456 [Blastomyces silverae]|uniref:Uncharacterized protein n=1 Tax=Blastomyces silverae TaxID=2060906 RepID=A0A0H1BI97_9EURO|nr:hypothetical protein EMPG_13456 [Blastomyces silverae]
MVHSGFKNPKIIELSFSFIVIQGLRIKSRLSLRHQLTASDQHISCLEGLNYRDLIDLDFKYSENVEILESNYLRSVVSYFISHICLIRKPYSRDKRPKELNLKILQVDPSKSQLQANRQWQSQVPPSQDI